jgi:hypothetical protein
MLSIVVLALVTAQRLGEARALSAATAGAQPG